MSQKDMLGVIVRKLVTLPLGVLGTVYDLLEKFADKEWVEAAKKFLRKENPWPASVVFDPTSFTLTVNCDAKLEDMVRAGRYGYVDPDFTSANFPTTRTGLATLEGRLEHFGRDMSTEAVMAALSQKGLRPGEPHELAEFGIEFPDVQSQHPVVALGGEHWTDAEGLECVACLGRWNGERKLGLDFTELDWGGDCRFLAFSE